MIRSYRNQKGNPISDEKRTGKLDEKTKTLSIKKIITELEKIQEIHLENGEEHRIPLTTKIQKEILATLKISN